MTNFKIAKVDFVGMVGSKGSKEYFFKTDIRTLKLGDKVVVNSKDSLATANFKGYVNAINGVPEKWIVQKIDMTAHNRKMKEEEKKNAERETSLKAIGSQIEQAQILLEQLYQAHAKLKSKIY